MASINKLSIRGIRSFSHEREQTIEFYAPLTMIVGANGCGKTTVIECLKYACTGALPPGARSGQSFVHDPKVSGTNEVKANIKMRFAGRDSRMSVVIRSLQLTQKRVTLQFKALDGVIRTKDDNGKNVSITHRCSDLDINIPLRMGVSKAILENVVFCHQEDSSWPLQEGAVVKKKFDDIFESARYTKALETIKKTKQEYGETVKHLKIDLAELQERLRAAGELKTELEASQEYYQSFHKEMVAIDERQRQVSESLEKLKIVAEQINALQDKKGTLDLTCRDLGVRKKEKEENIGNNLHGDSDEVLEANLRKFDEKFNEMADEIQRLEDAASECVTRAAEAKRRKGALQGEQGSLQAQIRHQERLVSERDRLMEQLATKHKIFDPAPSSASGGASRLEVSASRYTSKDVSTFEASLVKVVSRAEEELSEARAKARSEEEANMSDWNKLKLEQQDKARTLRTKEDELRQVHVSVGAMANVGGAGTLGGNSESQMASVTLSKLERELRNADALYESARREYEEHEESDARENINREIHALDARQATIKMEIDQEEDTLRRLSAQQGEQTRKAVISAEIADDESRLEERCRESSALNRSLDSPLQAVTPPALAEALGVVKVKRAETEEERASKEQDLIGLRRSVTEKETLLGQVRRELSTVDRELSNLLRAVEVVRAATREIEEEGGPSLDCTKDFQKVLELRRSQVETAKEEVIHQTHQKRFLAKQLKAARDNGHVCPTCRRGMDDEVYSAFKKAHDELMNDQKRESKIAEAKGRMNAAMEAVKHLENNAQGWREWARLSPRPAELEEERRKIELESAGLKGSLEKGHKEADDLRRTREELDQALSEAEKLVEESNRIERNRIEVQQLEAKLLRYGSGESLEKVRERARGLAAEKDRLVAEQQAKEKELRRLGEKQLTLTRDLTGREGDLKEAAANLMKKREFDKKREALRERERLLEVELRELKAQEQPMRQRMQLKLAEHNRAREHARSTLGRLETTSQRCRTDSQDFSRLRKEAETSLEKKLQEALASVGTKLEDAEQEATAMEQKAKVHETEMNGLIMNSEKQDQVKKILKENIEYRRINREIEENTVKIGDLDAQIREMDKEDVRGQMTVLEREKLQRTQKRAELKGRLDGMGEQIRGLELKLATDTYRHVEERHRRKMIEHRTTEMAVADLDKYWTALDKALLRFHTMKIADINKIIRELWALTYSGEDIDMVEIVSGDDGEEGGIKAKRSYNYRVVMRKNDATLDMKGRCSAGQRVLASVVIRLALAETFCVSCGILALDEPTTNLDQGNKVGLARALAKIISNRSKQSNFQLITITHDEEFKQMMSEELGIQGGFSMPEYYWRISREELSRGKFYSRIDRYHWEDM